MTLFLSLRGPPVRSLLLPHRQVMYPICWTRGVVVAWIRTTNWRDHCRRKSYARRHRLLTRHSDHRSLSCMRPLSRIVEVAAVGAIVTVLVGGAVLVTMVMTHTLIPACHHGELKVAMITCSVVGKWAAWGQGIASVVRRSPLQTC